MRSFLSKAFRPGLMKAEIEITAVGQQPPQWGSPPCQHPRGWGDKAMVTQGKLGCIPTSPCFREVWSVAQTLKIHQLPTFCLLPCLLQPPRAILPDGSFSPWSSSKLTGTTVSQGIHLRPTPPLASPKTFPFFHNTGITKLHWLTGRWQEDKMGSAQQQGLGGAPGHVPGMGGHTQVQLLGAGASARFRRDFRFCRCLLLRKHFYCAEGWDGE